MIGWAAVLLMVLLLGLWVWSWDWLLERLVGKVGSKPCTSTLNRLRVTLDREEAREDECPICLHPYGEGELDEELGVVWKRCFNPGCRRTVRGYYKEG